MKKKLYKIIMLFIILIALILTTVIFATTSTTTDTNYACILRSTEDVQGLSEHEKAMNNAKDTYETRGYSTNYKTDPSSLLILSNLLISKVQLFFSHGNVNNVSFKFIT